jgi:RNA polymerase sigma-70 factor (ECF subfamily)
MIELIPALKRFARSFCGSSIEAEDLVQDTILKALSNLDKFREGTRLKSWMFTIMRNTYCTKFAVARRERVGLGDDLDYLQVTQPHQEWSLRGRELETAIASLPHQYRSAFDLIFIEGVSYEVAARRCGCPVGTLKSRVSRAREQLTHKLDA